MLRIAICDDVDAQLQQIASLTKEYLTERGMSAELREFSHPDALLRACGKESFHIFLLDMVMPMLSGLELGREIRRGSSDAQIIYISTEPGFALDAYAVNPLHYLIKPVDKARLFADLALNVFFYLRGDYTTLAALDIAFFILVGAATKPLFRETLTQWLFNCFTVMNIYAITVVVSYFLSRASAASCGWTSP